VAGAVALLAGSGGTPTAQAQAPGPAWRLPASLHSDRNGLPKECLKTYSLTHVDHVLPNGTRHAATVAQGAASSDSLARAYYFGDDGSQVAEIVPPTGWKPVTATDQELKTYGFPPRPSGRAEFEHWTATMSKWKAPGRPGMCQTNLSAALPDAARPDGVTNATTSWSWAGGMTVNRSASVNTFTNSDGMWTQPRFINPCGTTADARYSIWSGLGGWNKNRLLQTGTDQGGEMWWEALAPNLSTNYQVIWTGSTVNAGDTVESYVTYSGDAELFLFDLTTGESQSAIWSSYRGQGAADFYDGTTADFITEDTQTSDGSSVFPLARPVAGYTYYSYATVDGRPISYYASWRLDQQNGGYTQQTSNWDGVHAWNDYWHHC